MSSQGSDHPLDARPLDPRWLPVVDEVARRVLGRDDRAGSALATQVAHLSELYTRERHALAHAGEARAARLRFYLLRDLPKVQGPLAELALLDALPKARTWRVLDVGAGLGTTTLGTAELARRAGAEALDVVALERDGAALDVFEQLAKAAAHAGLTVPIRLDARRLDVEELAPASLGPFDLVLVGLTLNELFPELEPSARLDAREAWLTELGARLAEGGSMVVIEPATRALGRELMALRDRFAARASGLRIFAPCLRDAPCPMLRRERDWCHDQLAFELPDALGRVAEEAGLRRERLTYAYLTLRHDGRRLWDHASRDPRAYRIVGGPVESKGKVEWEACGAEALARLRLLDRERGASNAVLDGAARGTLVQVDAPPRDDVRLRPDVSVSRLHR